MSREIKIVCYNYFTLNNQIKNRNLFDIINNIKQKHQNIKFQLNDSNNLIITYSFYIFTDFQPKIVENALNEVAEVLSKEYMKFVELNFPA